MEQTAGPASRLPAPDRMRRAVADYVAGVHEAYVRQASLLAPGAQGRLPLVAAGSFSVAAVGTRFLHLVATRDRLGTTLAGTRGDAARIDGAAGPLSWTLAFFDAVVLPALGLLDESEGARAEEVRGLLGVRTHLYHLILTPPADLAAHHAGHTGAGLAGAHAAGAREFASMRANVDAALAPLVEELEGAQTAGLSRAATLLAREIAGTDADVARIASEPAPDPAALRHAVAVALKGPRAGAAWPHDELAPHGAPRP